MGTRLTRQPGRSILVVMTTKSKIALITGANKGIGYATARGLAQQGFIVMLGARDVQRGTNAAAVLAPEGDVRFIHLDVTDEISVRTAAQKIEDNFGYLDVLINNAAISSDGNHFRKPSEETAAGIRAVYETNVFAVMTVTNVFLPLLRNASAGRIVNVTSKRGSIGEEGAWVGRPYMAYSTSKTALNAITAHYARELADTPIKINGAAPGHVATSFNNFSGKRTPDEGATVVIRLAQLDADGPTGLVFEDDNQLAW
jgi:NAD(P)-dependent dehydrogenase (short-subunit alcohol dehydrogenase family)